MVNILVYPNAEAITGFGSMLKSLSMDSISPNSKSSLSKKFKKFVNNKKKPIKMDNYSETDSDTNSLDINIDADFNFDRGERSRLEHQKSENMGNKEAYMNDVRRIVQDPETTSSNWGMAFEKFISKMFRDNKSRENKYVVNKLTMISGLEHILENLIPTMEYNNDKVKRAIRDHRETVQKNSGKNLRTFVKQFEGVADKLTYAEFNTLLYSFLTEESRKATDKKGLDPRQQTTSHYIAMLSRILANEIPNTRTLIERAEHFIPSNPYNIMDIYDEILNILNNIPNDVWPWEEKERKLYRIILRITPEPHKTELEDSLTYRDWDDVMQYPNRETIHNFLYRNKEFIDKNLNTKRKFEKYYPNYKVGKESRIKEIKPGAPKKSTKSNKCVHCEKTNHASDKCFRHPNELIRQQNKDESNGVNKCLLCRSSKHKEIACDTYENVTPIAIFCTICRERYGCKVFHPESICVNRPK